MTLVYFEILITIGGAVGWLPGSGLLIDKVIGSEIAAGITDSLWTAFRKQGIHAQELDVYLTDAVSRKQPTEDKSLHTHIALTLALKYTITNHEQIAQQSLTGWKKWLFPLIKRFIPDLETRVNQALARQINDQMHASLPDQIIEGLQKNNIDVVEVAVTSDELK